MVEDRWREIGPIGGIASGLVSCEEDALLVMACDMPMIDTESVQRLLDTYRENTSVILCSGTERTNSSVIRNLSEACTSCGNADDPGG